MLSENICKKCKSYRSQYSVFKCRHSGVRISRYLEVQKPEVSAWGCTGGRDEDLKSYINARRKCKDSSEDGCPYALEHLMETNGEQQDAK